MRPVARLLVALDCRRLESRDSTSVGFSTKSSQLLNFVTQRLEYILVSIPIRSTGIEHSLRNKSLVMEQVQVPSTRENTRGKRDG